MKQKKRVAAARREFDAAFARATKVSVCLALGGFLVVGWMHFCHSSGLRGLWADPRLLTCIALVLVGQPFVVLPIWHALCSPDGGKLFGRPVTRRDDPASWCALHGMFMAGGMLLIVLAVLNWSGVIDMTPSDWRFDAGD